MLNVLIIKTSSMGDIIHSLPALSDAAQAIPDITFDWVLEQSFAEIPRWHRHVNRVIPIRYRQWRKHPLTAWRSDEVKTCLAELRQQHYDYIIDAQGLYKSAAIAWLARGERHGMNRQSAREPLAHFSYQHQHAVSKQLHAITRVRHLFSQALKYPFPTSTPDYGIDRQRMRPLTQDYPQPYLVFLHGTTWQTKHWPETYWQQLVQLATKANYNVLLPWGSEREQQRATRLASQHPQAQVLPKLSLGELGSLLAGAQGIVSVDSGLGHLSAALSVPTVSLYGPTDPKRIGTLGQHQIHLKAEGFNCHSCSQNQCKQTSSAAQGIQPACFAPITAEKVWAALQQQLTAQRRTTDEQPSSVLY